MGIGIANGSTERIFDKAAITAANANNFVRLNTQPSLVLRCLRFVTLSL